MLFLLLPLSALPHRTKRTPPFLTTTSSHPIHLPQYVTFRTDDYNFGTLLRTNTKGEYSPDNTLLALRGQFYTIEIARNREGLNDSLKWEINQKPENTPTPFPPSERTHEKQDQPLVHSNNKNEQSVLYRHDWWTTLIRKKLPVVVTVAFMDVTAGNPALLLRWLFIANNRRRSKRQRKGWKRRWSKIGLITPIGRIDSSLSYPFPVPLKTH